MKPVVETVREQEGSAEAEKKSAQMLLFTFMIAAGALTGEAFYGVEAAILAVLDESAMGGYSWWPYARLFGFVMINVAFGALIYALFRRAGIIGPSEGGGKPPSRTIVDAGNAGKKTSAVLDAELAD